MRKKILITGGAGYIGSHVVENLLKSDYEIIVIDSFLFDQHSLKEHQDNKKLTIIKEDIRNLQKIENIFSNVDTVIHLAALVGEAACKISENETVSINLKSTENLVKIAIKKNVKKFIFMSTASSYGVQNVNQIANEDTKLNPVSLYAKTKIESEKLLLEKYSSDIEVTIFRPSTVYGHSMRMRFDLILNHLIKDAHFNKEIKVFGPKMVRPLMWVGEPARVYKKIIENETANFRSQIFNLGYNEENYEKIEIANLVKKKFFPNINIEIIEKDLDLRSYRLDFNKMKNFFGLKPHTDILKESKMIIDHFNEKKYGDVNNKIFYNA